MWRKAYYAITGTINLLKRKNNTKNNFNYVNLCKKKYFILQLLTFLYKLIICMIFFINLNQIDFHIWQNLNFIVSMSTKCRTPNILPSGMQNIFVKLLYVKSFLFQQQMLKLH